MSRAHGLGTDITLILAGATMGATAALLLAPASGEKTRHKIGRRYNRTVKRIGRYSDHVQDRAEDLLQHASEVREYAEEIRNRVAKVLHSGREALAA